MSFGLSPGILMLCSLGLCTAAEIVSIKESWKVVPLLSDVFSSHRHSSEFTSSVMVLCVSQISSWVVNVL